MAAHLLLAYNFPPMPGGISRWMAELALRYPARSLVVSTGPDPDPAASAAADWAFANRVDRLGIARHKLRTIPGLIAWSKRTVSLVRENDVSFMWCGNVKPPAYAAYYAHARLGTPYGVILHGTDLLQLRRNARAWAYKRLLARTLLGSAAVLVTNSNWTRTLALDILAEIGCDPARLDVRAVLLGTDPSFYRPQLDTAAVRAKYGLADGRWLLTVARFFPHKGQDVTIRALATLAATEPQLRYAMVGWGPYRPQLESLAAELGVADRVRFLENVPDDDLPALYNLADVYVGPSRNEDVHIEGFGISFAEASACAIPVVAGRSGGVPEAVIEGETGLLVDAQDPASVAGAVERLLRDRELAQRLGAGGRKAVEDYFNWGRVAREIRAIGEEHAQHTSHDPALAATRIP